MMMCIRAVFGRNQCPRAKLAKKRTDILHFSKSLRPLHALRVIVFKKISEKGVDVFMEIFN